MELKKVSKNERLATYELFLQAFKDWLADPSYVKMEEVHRLRRELDGQVVDE